MLDPSTLGDHIDRLSAPRGCPVRAEAEDLVQETFVRVLAKPRRIRDEDTSAICSRPCRNTFISSPRGGLGGLAPEALDDRFEPVDPRAGSRPAQAAEA